MKLLRLIPVLALLVALGGCTAPVLLATGTAGGVAVAHDKRTVGSMIDDKGIELKAMNAIAEHKELAQQARVSVTSYNGLALITGQAPTPAQRDEATNLVRHIDGVRKVDNEMSLGKPISFGQQAHDTWITTKVKTKLLNSDKVDGTRIKVVTEDGVVYLMGIISRQKADIAADIARTTDGVRLVVKVFEYTD